MLRYAIGRPATAADGAAAAEPLRARRPAAAGRGVL